MTAAATAPARRARAARRNTILGVLVLGVLGLASWASTVAISGEPWAHPFQVRIRLPPGAPLLHSGDDVRIGGERVGQVASVALAHGSRSAAVATLSLSAGTLGPGASARVRPRGLAGAVYVDLDPGRRGRRLPSGSLLRETTGGVQLTGVISGFDAATRRALATSLTGYGDGVAGRGTAVNQTLAAAPSLLSNATIALRALSPRPGLLSGLLGSATAVAGAVAPVRTDMLGGLVSSARAVLSTTGGLGATIRAVPPLERSVAAVLPGAERLLGRARIAASALTPGIAALSDALPALSSLESDDAALTTLARVAATAAPVLQALRPALDRLGGPGAGLTALSGPVAELASVLIPYRTELVQAPLGFTRWGGFRYTFGTGSGHRAVRFSMVLTCALARDPYPLPGAAAKERKPCP